MGSFIVLVVSVVAPIILANLGVISTVSMMDMAVDVLSKRVLYAGSEHGSDCAWYDQSDIKGSFNYHRNFSTYIDVGRWAKLSADIYLPNNWDGSPLPTILHFTRYNRAFNLKFPFSVLQSQVNLRTMISVRYLTKHGYAFVSVDVRGTGASSGYRTRDLSLDEAADFEKVMDWVEAQEFCDGNIGSLGSSYDGIVAEALTLHHHRALKSVVSLFAPFNPFTDAAMPGGVLSEGLLNNYDALTHAMETSKFEELYTFFPLPMKIAFKYILAHAALVDATPEDKAYGSYAFEEHSKNWKVREQIFEQNASFIDEVVADNMTIIEMAGSPEIAQRMSDSGVHFYFICSYWDSACLKGIQSRVEHMDTNRVKATIGPWNHALPTNADPMSISSKPCFNLFAEMVRWFDATLKSDCVACKRYGMPNPLPKREPRFHYHTLGKTGFRSCDDVSFPCEGKSVVNERMHFATNRKMVGNINDEAEDLNIDYIVDYSAGTTRVSRWNLVAQTRGINVVYPNRVFDDEKLVYFDTHIIDSERDVILTGTPFLHMNVTPDAHDGVFIAYLSDVSDTGVRFVQYITEGVVRGIHHLDFENPSQNYYTSRGRTLSTILPEDGGSGNVIEMELQPISYLLKRGHWLRISLAGADKFNFNDDLHGVRPSSWRLHDGYVDLPFELKRSV